jgi:signal transduction histidine kinase
MFRSIRWRLVVSYVLLALLTVSLVGVLTLSLVKRYVEQRVVDDLTANAESVARQAAALMWPVQRTPALRELARTSAFLGDVQVRILDDHQRVVADSGSPTGVDQLMWLTPHVELDLEPEILDQPWFMVLSLSRAAELELPHEIPFFEGLPSNVQWTIVSRIADVWGSRFTFEGVFEGQTSPRRSGEIERAISQSLGEEKAAPRSGHVITAPIGETVDPLGYVELSSGPNFAAEALATTRRAFIFAAGGAMLLAIVVGLIVSHGLSAPLRGLAATASRMGEDLSTRAPVRGQDEIGQLARQLNQMAERLEASFSALAADRDALRRFIADASHELRTPITALKNFNELLRGAAVDDPAAHAEFLAESAVQLDRLEWITHNLLDLSRLDAGLAGLDIERHAVAELVESAVAAFKPLAAENGVALSIHLPPSPLFLYCDRARIELALSNLLDNALKFASCGGSVEIGAEAAGESVRLWVQDDGPGIDPVDQSHIFERFYRGRGSHAEGSGLGLAIVQSVVQAHSGRVWVESSPGTGSRFVIELSPPDAQGGPAAP